VRVHEPLSVLDLIELHRPMHTWSLDAALAHIAGAGKGVAVLLNCGDETGDSLLAQLLPDTVADQPRASVDLRTYGVGAQILRELGVHRMKLLGSPRRMPSMTGYGLEVTGFVRPDDQP